MPKIKETLVQCSTCGTTFPSPVGFADTEGFSAPGAIVDVATNCPKGHHVRLDKASMAYRLADGTIGGAGEHFKV